MASKRLASFEGLDEKDITTLYNLAPIKRLKQGDALISEGDTDQTVYVVLDGLITVIKEIEGQMEVIATLGEGDWVGEIAFTQKIKRTASAIAKTQVSVLVFEKRTIEALDPRIQLFFFRRLNDLAAVRVNELSVKESMLSLKNRQLVNYIQSVIDRTKTDYSHSDMILGILKKVPRLPSFASRLALKTLDENFTPNELAEGIKDDPALVALILKIANSSYYELANPVADIHNAIMLLGFHEIYQMIIADGARRTMPDGLFFRDLHFAAVAASHISFCLSQESLTGRPQEIATIGLLQRLGVGDHPFTQGKKSQPDHVDRSHGPRPDRSSVTQGMEYARAGLSDRGIPGQPRVFTSGNDSGKYTRKHLRPFSDQPDCRFPVG